MRVLSEKQIDRVLQQVYQRDGTWPAKVGLAVRLAEAATIRAMLKAGYRLCAHAGTKGETT